MKPSIETIINAMKEAITCGSIPTNKAKTVQAHSAIVDALKANKGKKGKLPKGTIKHEEWVSGDSSVNKKPSSSFSYLKRTTAAIRKSDKELSLRTENNQGEENHGDVYIPQTL
ncbi:hypothetical protein Rs2_02931 [Raphanus sativus]|nr:hypothetical protein Rs2_02931 [Raphanus sativus]